ncbi:hypothetical protein CRUP_027237, partial [Coryphaenoides rupestris]
MRWTTSRSQSQRARKSRTSETSSTSSSKQIMHLTSRWTLTSWSGVSSCGHPWPSTWKLRAYP